MVSMTAALREKRTQEVDSRRTRDDKKWKRRLAKMDDATKAKFLGVGNTGEHMRTRGATRRSLRENKGRKDSTVAFETTIHLSKLVKGRSFAKRAPSAVKKIRAFAAQMMKTKDNRVDGSLNTFIWSQGVKGVPGRVRVLIQRKVAEDADGSSKKKRLYTVISHVPVASYKGMTTKQVTV